MTEEKTNNSTPAPPSPEPAEGPPPPPPPEPPTPAPIPPQPESPPPPPPPEPAPAEPTPKPAEQKKPEPTPEIEQPIPKPIAKTPKAPPPPQPSPEPVRSEPAESAPTVPSPPPPPQPSPKPAEEPLPVQKNNFPTRFKQKLKDLLTTANKKRLIQKETNLEKILAFAREHNRIDNEDVRRLTGVKDERAREYLNKLEKQGKLAQFGQKGPKVFYKPIK